MASLASRICRTLSMRPMVARGTDIDPASAQEAGAHEEGPRGGHHPGAFGSAGSAQTSTSGAGAGSSADFCGPAPFSGTSLTNTAATSATTATIEPSRNAECVPAETAYWYASRPGSGSFSRLFASSRADCSVTLEPSD